MKLFIDAIKFILSDWYIRITAYAMIIGVGSYWGFYRIGTDGTKSYADSVATVIVLAVIASIIMVISIGSECADQIEDAFESKNPKSLHDGMAFLALTMTCIAAWTMQPYGKWMNERVMVVVNDKVIAIQPQGSKRLQREIQEGEWYLPYYSKKHNAGSAVNPITENPKVRPLQYQVKFDWSMDPATRLKSYYFTKNLKIDGEQKVGFAQWIDYHLTEYNEKNSKHLARYYNKSSLKQQKEFKDEIVGYLTPMLEDSGIVIMDVSFDLKY